MQGEVDYIIITSSYMFILDSIIVAVIVASIANAIVVKILLTTIGSVRTVVLRKRERERERTIIIKGQVNCGQKLNAE
jgi:hypothetical protein